MHSHRFRFWVIGAAVAVGFGTMACGGSEPAPATRAPAADAKRVDAATAAHIKGRVTYEGPPAENAPIKMNADPACARAHTGPVTVDTTLVTNGGLENVFVYVRDDLRNYAFDVPSAPVVLDQKGCVYTPHVFGVRTGQAIEIVNSDPTMHNVHAIGSINREFNFGQHIQGMKNSKTFTAREVMVHFKCDVHTWMSAYAGVLDHPYFAVTSNGGQFELTGLPPGTYTIEAWHEKFGSRSQSVTVGAKETKGVTFSYRVVPE
jgi:plastocyanin